jgi:hypothetical protein
MKQFDKIKAQLIIDYKNASCALKEIKKCTNLTELSRLGLQRYYKYDDKPTDYLAKHGTLEEKEYYALLDKLHVGDTVKVIKEVNGFPWLAEWVYPMHNTIGSTGIIDVISKYGGVHVKFIKRGGYWQYHPKSLKLIKKSTNNLS